MYCYVEFYYINFYCSEKIIVDKYLTTNYQTNVIGDITDLETRRSQQRINPFHIYIYVNTRVRANVKYMRSTNCTSMYLHKTSTVQRVRQSFVKLNRTLCGVNVLVC